MSKTGHGRLLLLLALTVLITPACTSGDSMPAAEAVDMPREASAGVDMTPVEQAIAIAQRIEADPERAVEILEEFGLTEEQLDDLLYEIAADPELRKQYNDATGN